MRILHTSDWHLGRSFHGEDLLAVQAAYVDHLIDTVETEAVDLVVVSGDIYDRALPPVDAVALADDAFTRLAASRARVVATSGNHDSARRLGFSSRLVDAAGVHLRTDAGRADEPVLLEDEHGPVAVYGIPYLEPDVLHREWDLPARSHHAALAEAMRRIRADLATRPSGTRSVVLAHAFVVGGLPSESERDIAVGGISVVPLELFDGIDYTALGHLHGRATLTDSVRYSGSPVAYSFSEADHVKGSWLVDLDAGGLADVRFVPSTCRSSAGVPGRHHRRPAHRSPARRTRGVVGAGDPHRRDQAGPRDGAAAGPLPARPRPAVRTDRRRGAAPAPGHPRPVSPRGRARVRQPRPWDPGDSGRVRAAADRPRVLHGGSRPRGRTGRLGERLMRLHELSITAFGPFVDTVHVDFDELAASGLFLLTGDTGAGKTSVLDAVCFAFYGEVPGDRHSARHLRSDHADPQAEPRVVLRASVGARTFRLTRSPAWDRPKRRGTGTTRVQAHVVVEEQRGGEWLTLTNRLDEAGQLVTGLLGMTCTQFTQVAMLPQGRFQAFLRATSPERHAVLQRLFRTRRFEEVERWLVDRRVDLGRRSRTCHDRSAGVVSRIQEAAGVELPAGWEPNDLEPRVDDGELSAWASGPGRERGDRGLHAPGRPVGGD